VRLAGPISAVALALALAIIAPGAAAQAQPEELAQKSAEMWLAKVDAGKYAESWQDAAQLFKDRISKGQWQTTAHAVRAPLGKLQSRKLKSITSKTSLPGAPDAQYVILQYDSSFEHKKSAVETVTVMLDKDGAWRISGYFIS
jgi:hypothetical protein